MIHWREECCPVRNGINYRWDAYSKPELVLRVGPHIFVFRYSTRLGKFIFKHHKV